MEALNKVMMLEIQRQEVHHLWTMKVGMNGEMFGSDIFHVIYKGEGGTAKRSAPFALYIMVSSSSHSFLMIITMKKE